jgi:hypothetical protein
MNANRPEDFPVGRVIPNPPRLALTASNRRVKDNAPYLARRLRGIVDSLLLSPILAPTRAIRGPILPRSP